MKIIHKINNRKAIIEYLILTKTKFNAFIEKNSKEIFEAERKDMKIAIRKWFNESETGDFILFQHLDYFSFETNKKQAFKTIEMIMTECNIEERDFTLIKIK